MCSHPYQFRNSEGFLNEVRCGQCLLCRIYKQMMWTGRLCLEVKEHEHCRFVTLTYAADPGILDIKDFQLFMQRYRNHYGPCRYFAVGEYGLQNGRGHWHAIIFGQSATTVGPWKNNKAWDKGFSSDGIVSLGSLRYVAKYCMKLDPRPEYRPRLLMSLKPGIGFRGIDKLAIAAAKLAPPDHLKTWPMRYQIGSKTYPLGDGLKARFINTYLENGGMPPPEASQISADLRVRSEWLDAGGIRFQNYQKSLQNHLEVTYGTPKAQLSERSPYYKTSGR